MKEPVTITIELHHVLYAELQAAASELADSGITPARWAEEAVESALASRRLPRFAKPAIVTDVCKLVEHTITTSAVRLRDSAACL